MAADPFQAEAFWERLTRARGLLLLFAYMGALLLLVVSTDFRHERDVEAIVVRLGTYPDPLATGDLPIVTVRLPDGSIRQLRASWPAVNRCGPGSSISLLQLGRRLRVGLGGCHPKH
jgi:hypothetical protein